MTGLGDAPIMYRIDCTPGAGSGGSNLVSFFYRYRNGTWVSAGSVSTSINTYNVGPALVVGTINNGSAGYAQYTTIMSPINWLMLDGIDNPNP